MTKFGFDTRVADTSPSSICSLVIWLLMDGRANKWLSEYHVPIWIASQNSGPAGVHLWPLQVVNRWPAQVSRAISLEFQFMRPDTQRNLDILTFVNYDGDLKLLTSHQVALTRKSDNGDNRLNFAH